MDLTLKSLSIKVFQFEFSLSLSLSLAVSLFLALSYPPLFPLSLPLPPLFHLLRYHQKAAEGQSLTDTTGDQIQINPVTLRISPPPPPINSPSPSIISFSLVVPLSSVPCLFIRRHDNLLADVLVSILVDLGYQFSYRLNKNLCSVGALIIHGSELAVYSSGERCA